MWKYENVKNVVRLKLVSLKLNRIVAVQECDATMMNREQMPETKN